MSKKYQEPGLCGECSKVAHTMMLRKCKKCKKESMMSSAFKHCAACAETLNECAMESCSTKLKLKNVKAVTVAAPKCCDAKKG